MEEVIQAIKTGAETKKRCEQEWLDSRGGVCFVCKVCVCVQGVRCKVCICVFACECE